MYAQNKTIEELSSEKRSLLAALDSAREQVQAASKEAAKAAKEKERRLASDAKAATLTRDARQQANQRERRVEALKTAHAAELATQAAQLKAVVDTLEAAKQSAASVESELTELRAELAAEQASASSLRTQLEERDATISERDATMEERDATIKERDATIKGTPGRGHAGLQVRAERAEAKLKEMCSSLRLRYSKLPSKVLPARYDASDHVYCDQVAFVQAALEDRAPIVIATALKQNGQIEAVIDTPPFQPTLKAKIERVLHVIQEHWGARHALFVMSEVHTSRDEFDTLRHLLSFIYNRDRDMYEKIAVWVNPHDPADTLGAPTLCSRKPREAERDRVYSLVGAEASNDGLYCGRIDLEKGLRELIEHYWDALDPRVREGQVEVVAIITGDATGGWRGSSITHAEAAIGSWADGKGQSRLTVLPLYIMEGDDGAVNLRNRAGPSAASFNQLKRKGAISVRVGGKELKLKLKLLTAADFQFHKAANNQSKYRSSIWCTCDEELWFKLPETRAKVWADCIAFFASFGCKLKTLKDICELNHWPFELLEGKAFKQFGCRWCPFKSGTEIQWRAKVEAHAQLEGTALKEANLAHSQIHLRHNPYNSPLYHQPAIDASADVLHLVFINTFTTRFELTILNYIFEYEPELREPFEIYVNSIGIPLKVVKATSVAEMKQALTGRDAKNLICKALDHIPTLLEFAHAGEDAVREEVEAADAPPPPRRRADVDNEFEWDSGGEEEEEQEEEEASMMGDFDLTYVDSMRIELRSAKAWDAFCSLAYSMRPFARDDGEYREARAVEAFNAAALDMAWTKKLQPEAKSACPHVALRVVTEQMVVHGDPNRRGTDHSESFGAMIKDGIHRRTLRRRLGKAVTEHKRRKGGDGKTWKQRPLSVSRVMQVFRHVSVREVLLRDAASQRYLQRKHVRTASTGFATAASACGPCRECEPEAEALPPSIYEKMREGREEGGEPPQ